MLGQIKPLYKKGKKIEEYLSCNFAGFSASSMNGMNGLCTCFIYVPKVLELRKGCFCSLPTDIDSCQQRN